MTDADLADLITLADALRVGFTAETEAMLPASRQMHARTLPRPRLGAGYRGAPEFGRRFFSAIAWVPIPTHAPAAVVIRRRLAFIRGTARVATRRYRAVLYVALGAGAAPSTDVLDRLGVFAAANYTDVPAHARVEWATTELLSALRDVYDYVGLRGFVPITEEDRARALARMKRHCHVMSLSGTRDTRAPEAATGSVHEGRRPTATG